MSLLDRLPPDPTEEEVQLISRAVRASARTGSLRLSTTPAQPTPASTSANLASATSARPNSVLTNPTATATAHAAPASAAAAAHAPHPTDDIVKAALGTQQPTVILASNFLQERLKATIRSDRTAKTAKLSNDDALVLASVTAWLDEAILRTIHTPVSNEVESRLTILTKAVDRNTTELSKMRSTLIPPPARVEDAEDEEQSVEKQLGLPPPSFASIAAQRKSSPLKVPLEQRLEPFECLLKRSGTEDPSFTSLPPADKVKKIRESILASLPTDTIDSAIAQADPAKLVRAVRPLPSGDLVIVSLDKHHSILLQAHSSQWLPKTTPSLGLHSPSFGAVLHRMRTTFDPSNPLHLAALRTENDNLLPADIKVFWLCKLPLDGSKKHSSLVIHFPTKSQANNAIQQGIAFEGRLLRVEKVMRSPPQYWRCQRYGHTSLQCKQPPRCGTCASFHLTKDCTCPADTPCASTSDCTHIPLKCANCSMAHNASSEFCSARRQAFDAAKVRILRSGELYPLTSSST